jgi:hypothetical protein
MHQQVDTVPSIRTTLVLAAIGSDGDVQMMTMERRDDDGRRWRMMREGEAEGDRGLYERRCVSDNQNVGGWGWEREEGRVREGVVWDVRVVM